MKTIEPVGAERGLDADADRRDGIEHLRRLDALRREWRAVYQPRTPEAEWLLGLLVTSALRVEVCQANVVTGMELSAQRARLCWETDRACQAEELAVKLARRPGAVTARLKSFKQGAELLLKRWRGLLLLLDHAGNWTEEQTALARLLLGGEGSADARASWDDQPDEARSLAQREIRDLERLISEKLATLDDLERAAAIEGQPLEHSAAVKSLRREASAALRTFRWVQQALVALSPPQNAPSPAKPSNPDDLEGYESLDEKDEDDGSEGLDDDEPVGMMRAPLSASTLTTESRRDRRAARKRQRAARRRR